MGNANLDVADEQSQFSKGLVISAEFKEIVACCQRSAIGKLLPSALYVHGSALESLDRLLQKYEQIARSWLGTLPFTLVKFQLDQPKVSYLVYPDFDEDAHPALHSSHLVDLITREVAVRNYQHSSNPPVLHRKETFVTSDYPLYPLFTELTRQEEALGLLKQSWETGTRDGWAKQLTDSRIKIQGHILACPLTHPPTHSPIHPPTIDRHKAALVRTELSKPVRVALEAGLFTPETTFFDYGCGHGGDVERIGAYSVGETASQRGYTSSGWDPYYRPDAACVAADAVNLGYIINVQQRDEKHCLKLGS